MRCCGSATPMRGPISSTCWIPLGKARWYGRANKLSHEHVRWPDIDLIQRATHKPLTQEPAAPAPVALPPPVGARP